VSLVKLFGNFFYQQWLPRCYFMLYMYTEHKISPSIWLWT